MTFTRTLLLVLALGCGASLAAEDTTAPKADPVCAACPKENKDKKCDSCTKKTEEAKKAADKKAEGKKAGCCGGCSK